MATTFLRVALFVFALLLASAFGRGDVVKSTSLLDLALRPVSHLQCLQQKIPKFPVPTGAEDEIVLTTCSERALQDAMAQMSRIRAGSLFFDCGEGDHTIRISSSLTLARSGHYKLVVLSGTVTLDGRNRVPIMRCGGAGRLQVFGLRFVRGFTDGKPGGAAIFTGWRTTLRIVRCHFEGNRAASDRAVNGGGAVNALGGGVFIWNSVFINNRAPAGGAVQVTSGNMRVLNSVFRRNFAVGGFDGRQVITGHGGALRCDRLHGIKALPARICGCEFEENGILAQPGSRDKGGAVEVYGHNDHLPEETTTLFELVRSRFVGNGVGDGSPTIVVAHGAGNVTISDVEFIDNKCFGQTVRIGSPRRPDTWAATVTNVTFNDDPSVITGLRVDGHVCYVSDVISNGEFITCE